MIETAILLSKKLCESRAAHAARVANLLGDASETEIAAAYLHDILEDEELDFVELRLIMGDKVAKIVMELTRVPFSRDRTFESLRNASPEAKRIKLADRIDNIRKRMTSNDVMSYVLETEHLLGILNGTDSNLENILREHVEELRAKCTKYLHENIS